MALNLPSDLLVHAQQLLDSTGRPMQVNLRRSISASYYASFHCICDTWASKFDSDLHKMLCRCPSHTQIREAAIRLKTATNPWRKGVVPSEKMKTMCEDFLHLHGMRTKADYDLAEPFRKRDAILAHRKSSAVLGTMSWAKSHCRGELDAFLLQSLKITPRTEIES